MPSSLDALIRQVRARYPADRDILAPARDDWVRSVRSFVDGFCSRWERYEGWTEAHLRGLGGDGPSTSDIPDDSGEPTGRSRLEVRARPARHRAHAGSERPADVGSDEADRAVRAGSDSARHDRETSLSSPSFRGSARGALRTAWPSSAVDCASGGNENDTPPMMRRNRPEGDPETPPRGRDRDREIGDRYDPMRPAQRRRPVLDTRSVDRLVSPFSTGERVVSRVERRVGEDGADRVDPAEIENPLIRRVPRRDADSHASAERREEALRRAAEREWKRREF